MAYDPTRAVSVLFGGFTGADSSQETWEYDGTTWSLRSTNGPAARLAHAMAFDASRGTTILFGGSVGGAIGMINGECWEWNGQSWSRLNIPGPAPRFYHSMAYDAARRGSVLFGGQGIGPTTLTDTWGLRTCYANCDGSTTAPILNASDLVCFMTRFAAGNPYASCDGSTTPPILNINDFICFQQKLVRRPPP